jgi:uncharacterized protein YbjT (DUF2867 family)
MKSRGIALVTGATGFVGSRLVPALVADGWTVRSGARDPSRVKGHRDALPVRVDMDVPSTLGPALEHCDVAFYLIHSLKGARRGYERREVVQATAFARAAEAAHVGRLVYLGGLAPSHGHPSRHLAGRIAVGERLREGPVPCLELRASMIIGSASSSFRMLRDLSARLPAMILPRWLDHRTEPVAIDDVIAALVAGARMPLPASAVFDIDGPEVMTCREIVMRMAALLGTKPRAIGVPVLTPRLSSWWIRFVSGVDVPLARELVDGLASDLVATHGRFREQAGLPPPIPFDEAVRRALAEQRSEPRGSAIAAWEKLVRLIAPR